MDGTQEAALVQGMTEINTSLINAKAEKNRAAEQRKHDKEMSDYTYSKDVAQWERQNRYNTPSAQMARFKEAGLNPHLIYGKGTPGNSSSSPAYSKPSAEHTIKPLATVDWLGKYQDFRVKNAQVDNLKQMNENLKSDKINRDLQNLITGYDAKLKPKKNQYQAQQMELLNQQLEKNVKIAATNAGIRDNDLEWSKRKLEEFQESGINIDKDNSYLRIGKNLFDKFKKFEVKKTDTDFWGRPRKD